MKHCVRCRIPKPESDFSVSKLNSDGLYSYCKACHSRAGRERYQKSSVLREKLRSERKEKRRNDGGEIRKWHREYLRIRRKDPLFRLKAALRTRLIDALRGGTKSARTLTLLGCSIEELRAHLEKQFLPGMNWENWGRGNGKWQVDHIRPCDSFDLSDPEQQQQCFNFRNLQPLWFLDNVRKGAKYSGNSSLPGHVYHLSQVPDNTS